jgi:hypothetical protein
MRGFQGFVVVKDRVIGCAQMAIRAIRNARAFRVPVTGKVGLMGLTAHEAYLKITRYIVKKVWMTQYAIVLAVIVLRVVAAIISMMKCGCMTHLTRPLIRWDPICQLIKGR